MKCLDKIFKLWMQVCTQKLNTLVNFSFKLRWLYLYLCRYLLPNCCLKHLILLCLLLNHTWVKTETGSKNGKKCPKKAENLKLSCNQANSSNNICNSWDNAFDQVSKWLDINYGFYCYSQFLNQSHFLCPSIYLSSFYDFWSPLKERNSF